MTIYSNLLGIALLLLPCIGNAMARWWLDSYNILA